MKKLLTTLVVLSWAFIVTAQTNPFAGQWFGVATPTGFAANHFFNRTLMGITVETNGAVQITRFDYFGDEFDDLTGNLTLKGKFVFAPSEDDSLILSFSRKGRGTGVGKFTSSAFPNVVLRESITLYRENVK